MLQISDLKFCVLLIILNQTSQSFYINFQSRHLQLTHIFSMLIGKGSFSEVVLHQDKQKSPSVFAIKKIYSNTHDKIKKYFLTQVQILASLNHPNIVKYHGYSFQQNQFQLQMEYIEGFTLQQFHKKYPQQCSFQVIMDWMFQVCCGLSYLHQVKEVVHRDIKQQNIMITKEGVVKIIDFGVSVQYKKGLCQCIGSPSHMAPQVFQKKEYSFQVDIWSFGMTIYSLIYGNLPFSAKSKEQYWKMTLNSSIPFYRTRKFKSQQQQIQKNLISLLKSMLHQNPQKRPTASQIMRQIQRYQQKKNGLVKKQHKNLNLVLY